jgi:hypothetical protein
MEKKRDWKVEDFLFVGKWDMNGIEESKENTYIELLLGFREAFTSTAVDKENYGVDVGEILLPDFTS